jgi:hypothetical protein
LIYSLLLGLVLSGQCGPQGCPYRPRPIIAPAPPVPAPAPAPDWGWHLISYQGSTAWIWGYHLDAFTITSNFTPVLVKAPEPIPQAPDPIPQAPDPIPQPACRH